MKFCNCNGRIAECDHDAHPLVTSFGSIRDMWTGKIVKENSDPSWQCAGCGMPRTSIEPKKVSPPDSDPNPDHREI